MPILPPTLIRCYTDDATATEQINAFERQGYEVVNMSAATVLEWDARAKRQIPVHGLWVMMKRGRSSAAETLKSIGAFGSVEFAA